MAKRRLSIFARRAELAGIAPPTFSWPAYLVTAPHGVWGAADDAHPWSPHGDWHARRAGSLQTACGRSAVTWHFFWTLDFAEAGARACAACEAALVGERIRS